MSQEYMSQENDHSREAFDRAQEREDDAVNKMSEEIRKTSRRRLAQLPYRDLPSQEVYYEAAERKYEIIDQAREEARSLEERHRNLIEAADKAQQALVDFETNELDMHQNRSV